MSGKFDDLLNVPWKLHGDDKDGMDCWNLAREVYRRLGKELPRFSYPDPGDDTDTVHDLIMSETMFAERLDQAIPFCFAEFSVFSPRVNHIGVVLEDRDHFIHVLRGGCVSIERLSSFFWKQRLKGFYKWIRT